MKKTILGKVVLLSLAVAFISCEKEDNGMDKAKPGNGEKPMELKVEHYLDGKPVSKEVLDKLENREYVFVSPKQGRTEEIEFEVTRPGKPITKINSATIVVVEAFSTEEGYINYGTKHNLHVKEQLTFEKAMREYAEKTGAIKHYEKTGEVTKDYKKYEKMMYAKYLGHLQQDKTVITTLYKDYFGGPSWTFVNHSPFMVPGWNNTVSSFTPVGIYGVTILYDRSFYRTRMANFWGWGFNRVLLYWGWTWNLNNRTSSALSY